MRSIAQSDHESAMPVSDHTTLGSSKMSERQPIPNTMTKSRRKRAISPLSNADTASLTGTLAGHQESRKRRMVSSGQASPSFADLEPSVRKTSHSRLNLVQTSTPMTPHTETICDQKTPAWMLETQQSDDLEDFTSGTTSCTVEANKKDDQLLSSESFVGDSELRTPWRNLAIGSVMTPRVEDEGEGGFSQTSQAERPRPMVLDTAAAQDASLPSPSLSPVTAAANMQSRREYFEQPYAEDTQNSLGQLSTSRSFQSLASSSQKSMSTRGSEDDPEIFQNLDTSRAAPSSIEGRPSTRSLMSIPSMVDTFEAMPEEMKSYLVYQFLRRCSKPVLHFVADVVNPALKCDFLRMLPVELCLNVIGNLDAKTLCRAAQVSRRWRQLIDSSEKVWKRLFDADNYTLPEGELSRAVREGWGWQHASQSSEFEKDLRALTINQMDTTSSSIIPTEASTSGANATPNGSLAVSQIKRSKRKAKPKSKPMLRKQQKRIQTPSTDPMILDDEIFLDLASADGPYAAANAAERAVPFPQVGLPSLKNLHLFKSIYMRHHIIRNTWMNDDVSPKHIAFRAHQRHVVTCLQFDADKIITGSDDANINVYDTKTGALRSTLEGHEGGVWALQYEGNVLVSGSTDRTVRVWDIEKGRCTQIFQGHTSTVRCLQILMPTVVGKTRDERSILMPKQPLIITGSRDSNLRVWKLPKLGDPDSFQTGSAPDEAAECPYYIRTLAGHHHSVRAIAAHADTLVSGSYDCSVRVWKISTGETVHRLNGHNQKVYSVVLDTKRNRCISGSMDNFVKVWSLETGSVLFNLEGHSSLVGLLDLQQDRLVSAAADSTLRIWDPETGHCKSTLSAHTGAITCFQHDGQKVISGSDRTLKMWNVANGEFAKDLLTDLSGVWQVKFNERRCVAAVQRNALTYIEVGYNRNARKEGSMLTAHAGLGLRRLKGRYSKA